MITTRHILRSTIACVIALALATPAVSAAQDLRSPDARDAAATSSLAGTTTSPAFDAPMERPYIGPPQANDLRSPNARDAEAGRGTFSTPDVTVVKPAPVHADGGLDWADAGIGAAILLGAIAVGLAGVMAVVRRRRHHPAAV